MNNMNNSVDFSLIRILKGDKKGTVFPCSADQKLIIGSDESQCDLVLNGQGILPVHAFFYFDPKSQLIGIQDCSEGKLVFENGLSLPESRVLYVPEGTILYVGSENQAILLGRKDCTSYRSPELPPGTYLGNQYRLESKYLQTSQGILYNGIKIFKEGASSAEEKSSFETVTIYCVHRDHDHPYYEEHAFEQMDQVMDIITEYNVVFYILPDSAALSFDPERTQEVS